MKLFSPTQTKTLFTNKQAEDIEKIGYLTKTLTGLQRQINDANEQFKLRLAEQRTLYAGEKERLQSEIKELDGKLSILRQELEKYLEPTGEYRAMTEVALLDALERSQTLEEKENDYGYRLEKLQGKIDEITSRESDIDRREKEVNVRKDSIDSEAKMVSQGHIRLNEMMQAFQKELTEKTQVIKERENAMLIVEQRNKEYLEKREKELSEYQRKLEDQRGVLDRLYKEIKRLQK